jgi:hypothetical protein
VGGGVSTQLVHKKYRRTFGFSPQIVINVKTSFSDIFQKLKRSARRCNRDKYLKQK